MSYAKFITVFFVTFIIGSLVVAGAQSFVVNFKDYTKVQIVEPIESNGGIPVNLQDQTTPMIIMPLHQEIGNTTLSGNFTIGDYVIPLVSVSGISNGDYVEVFNVANQRFWHGTVLSISGTNLTVDSPSDFNFTSGDPFHNGNKQLNVDGSSTIQTFSGGLHENLGLEYDITRIIFHMTDGQAMDDTKFGGISALTNGIVLRSRNGVYNNVFNVKSNGEIGEIAFDKRYEEKAGGGSYGFSSRLTFAGQNKIGVTIRLEDNDDLELLVQDDLTGLSTFTIIAEGHIVQN